MKYILCTIGIVGSFFLIIYREAVGDMIGEADWMRNVGGVHLVVVFAAIIIFFLSLAELTGTTFILLRPLMYLVPGAGPVPTGSF